MCFDLGLGHAPLPLRRLRRFPRPKGSPPPPPPGGGALRYAPVGAGGGLGVAGGAGPPPPTLLLPCCGRHSGGTRARPEEPASRPAPLPAILRGGSLGRGEAPACASLRPLRLTAAGSLGCSLLTGQAFATAPPNSLRSPLRGCGKLSPCVPPSAPLLTPMKPGSSARLTPVHLPSCNDPCPIRSPGLAPKAFGCTLTMPVHANLSIESG